MDIAVRKASSDLRDRWRAMDVDVLAIYVAAGIFFVGGLLSLVALVVLRSSSVDPRYDWRISVLAIGIGLAGPVIPWRRWAPQVQMLYAVAALALIAVGGMSFGGHITP